MKMHSVFLLVIVALLTASCAKKVTRVDRFYGTSYALAKESQIHNPQAGMADGAAEGLDGTVAAKVVDRYEKGFEREPPKTDSFSVSFEGIDVKK